MSASRSSTYRRKDRDSMIASRAKGAPAAPVDATMSLAAAAAAAADAKGTERTAKGNFVSSEATPVAPRKQTTGTAAARASIATLGKGSNRDDIMKTSAT